METTTNPKGRPSKRRQLEIDEILRPYHQKTISILKTAQITDISRTTVSKRFNKWDAIEVKEHNKKVEQEIEAARIEYENLLQYLIEKQIEIYDKLGNEIDETHNRGGKLSPHIINNANQVSKTIENFAEKRFILKSHPGEIWWMKKTLDMEIKKRNVKPTSSN